MNAQLRMLFLGVIAVLTAGWLALRSGNAELEATRAGADTAKAEAK